MNTSNGSASNSERHYPMLESCRIVLQIATGGKRPPVRLPQDCLSASRSELPPIYDFSLGKECSIVNRGNGISGIRKCVWKIIFYGCHGPLTDPFFRTLVHPRSWKLNRHICFREHICAMLYYTSFTCCIRTRNYLQQGRSIPGAAICRKSGRIGKIYSGTHAGRHQGSASSLCSSARRKPLRPQDVRGSFLSVLEATRKPSKR
jgi:hypothetical protein